MENEGNEMSLEGHRVRLDDGLEGVDLFGVENGIEGFSRLRVGGGDPISCGERKLAFPGALDPHWRGDIEVVFVSEVSARREVVANPWSDPLALWALVFDLPGNAQGGFVGDGLDGPRDNEAVNVRAIAGVSKGEGGSPDGIVGDVELGLEASIGVESTGYAEAFLE